MQHILQIVASAANLESTAWTSSTEVTTFYTSLDREQRQNGNSKKIYSRHYMTERIKEHEADETSISICQQYDFTRW